jgi:hypothetical protein
VVLTRDGGTGGGKTEVATGSSAPGQPHQVRMLNGQVPGQATADGDGTAIHVYGPDGHETSTVDLGPIDDVQAAASDLEGGWVVCGMVPVPPPDNYGPAAGVPGPSDGTTTVPASTATTAGDAADAAADEIGKNRGAATGDWGDRLMWYPADGDPVDLMPDGAPMCSENSVQVVDSPDGPIALLGVMDLDPEGPSVHLDGIVLATGESRSLAVSDLPGLPDQWSATTGRVLTYIEGVGLQLYDLDEGEQLPTATIDPGQISELALAHDGKTAAVMIGSIEGPDEVVVYDLATGAEVFRKSFDMSIEGDSMSYDGKTLAVGNYYPNYGPITVIDMATHAEHTIDASGVVL